MSETTVGERPVRPAEHRAGCPCLACADWRDARRADMVGYPGRRPTPARDWRGETFP